MLALARRVDVRVLLLGIVSSGLGGCVASSDWRERAYADAGPRWSTEPRQRRFGFEFDDRRELDAERVRPTRRRSSDLRDRYDDRDTEGVPIGRPYYESGRWWQPRHNPNYDRVGIGVWYGRERDGLRTASGEAFDMWDMTAAHKTLAFGTIVAVTNLENGRRVRVRINDRGPFNRGRLISVSRAAGVRLGLLGPGRARVRVRYVSGGGGWRRAERRRPRRDFYRRRNPIGGLIEDDRRIRDRSPPPRRLRRDRDLWRDDRETRRDDDDVFRSGEGRRWSLSDGTPDRDRRRRFD
ncbi:MAG: septal ring lytic transglycosylase RlpA family protein [Pseudomonadota bacterium]